MLSSQDRDVSHSIRWVLDVKQSDESPWEFLPLVGHQPVCGHGVMYVPRPELIRVKAVIVPKDERVSGLGLNHSRQEALLSPWR